MFVQCRIHGEEGGAADRWPFQASDVMMPGSREDPVAAFSKRSDPLRGKYLIEIISKHIYTYV